MSKLEILTGKPHLSYSAISTLFDCGERFRLERVAQVPQAPAWWFIGGSAFHTATEYIDYGAEEDPQRAWDLAWEKKLAEDVPDGDLSVVRAGGRATKEWPNKQDGDWWDYHGPGMVAEYIKAMDKMRAEGWKLWTVEDGVRAIEIPFTVQIGSAAIKGAIDRVLVNPDGELVIVDLKAGSSVPQSTMQLGVYSVALEKIFGIKPILGSYYMARKAELTEPVSLLHYTESMLGSVIDAAKRMIEAEIFLPHVSNLCKACGVREYCTVMAN